MAYGMTPAQVETSARRLYNSESSTFWSQDELFKLIYEAEMILAEEALVIEARDTTLTTVAGTRSYSVPAGFLAIKRIEVNGTKLQPIDFREDDTLTLNNADATQQGNPQFYSIWNDTIYLRPIPDAVYTVTIYGHKEAVLLTTASTTLSTPSRCHSALIDYVVGEMAAKDSNIEFGSYYTGRWDKYVERQKALSVKKKRADGFAVVKDEESLAVTLLGLT